MELVVPSSVSTAACVSCSLTPTRLHSRSNFVAGRFALDGKLKLVAAPTFSGRRARCLKVSAGKQTFGSFEELLEKSELPLLVDFYAVWCGPCQFMVPILNEVGNVMKGEVTVVKIDTEKYPALATKYSIEALPTIILFKDGEPIDRVEGALPAAKLMGRIRDALGSCKAGV